MAITISTAEKSLVAREVLGLPYGSLTTDQAAQLDAVSTQALNRVNQFAQHFVYTGATDDLGTQTPAPWLHVWQCEAALILARTYRTDLVESKQRQRDEAWDAALDSYTSLSPSATSLAGGTLTLNEVRKYVMAHCARLNPRRLFVDVLTIDAKLQEVINRLWNAKRWNFRQKRFTLDVTGIALSGGDWTQSTLTLSGVDTTSYAHLAGSVLRVTGGTGVVVGDYAIASKPGNTSLVLAASPARAGADLSNGDITGVIMRTAPFGLATGQTFDKPSNLKFWLAPHMESIQFAGAENMGALMAFGQSDTGTPRYFTVEKSGTTLSWAWWPAPDTTYTVQAQCALKGPTLPTSSTSTAEFALFPDDFLPWVRDLTLDGVLEGHGRVPRGTLTSRFSDAVADLQAYDDKGTIDDDVGPRDAYGDFGAVLGDAAGSSPWLS